MSFTMQMGSRKYVKLSLEQRMMVIKSFKHTPNYNRLASYFHCSTRQVRSIIANRDKIKRYHNERAKKLAEEIVNRRREKIDFLCEVVYEFLLRAHYLRMPIDISIIRTKAFEVKEALAIENFTPNNDWLQVFKSHYDTLDLPGMTEQLPSSMEERRSLKCIDIMEYISKQAGGKEEKTHMEAEDTPGSGRNDSEKAIQNFMKSENDVDDHKAYGSTKDDLGNHESVENMSTTSASAAPIVVDLDSDEEDEEVESAVVKAEETVSANTSCFATKPILKPSTPPPFPDIDSYPEAMRHLKVLEDFAMMKENYRAIGLITQLEQIFKNPPKLKS
ncbi:uncharacterized protein LOC118747184 [Rhagoletis pomonella]|uniref:uncharacterized protein LOC118747184 n=1 Tax=Rhagoletis pomonella TaxID=28610 RepID=UPI00177B1A17|nr:uncharacterized protein LOC118747184 [Rhagoletis pomonella]